MTKDEISQIAKLFVLNIRDMAIKSCDIQLTTKNLNSPTARRWREKKGSGDIEEYEKMLVADSIDEAIFFLFQSIDNGMLNITLNLPNGRNIDLTKEGHGELAGYYIGEWRSDYSEERCFFDF